MNNSHIVSTYDEDLNLLKTNLTELGLKVEKQIFRSVNLTKIINLSEAKQIIEDDNEIDSLEIVIRQQSIATLSAISR